MSKFDWFTWIWDSALENIVNSCTDQLWYNLNLIKLCSAYAKQKAAAVMLVQC